MQSTLPYRKGIAIPSTPARGAAEHCQGLDLGLSAALCPQEFGKALTSHHTPAAGYDYRHPTQHRKTSNLIFSSHGYIFLSYSPTNSIPSSLCTFASNFLSGRYISAVIDGHCSSSGLKPILIMVSCRVLSYFSLSTVYE